MPTLQEASIQLQTAQSQLEAERLRVAQARSQAEKIKIPRRSLEFQQQYVKTGKIPIGLVEQRIAKTRRERATKIGQIQQAEQSIQSQRAEIARQQAEVGGAIAEQESQARVMEMINRKIRGQRIAYANLTDAEKKMYKEISKQPEVRRALDAGAGIAIGARQANMNPLEFSNIQGYGERYLVGKQEYNPQTKEWNIVKTNIPDAKVIKVSKSLEPTMTVTRQDFRQVPIGSKEYYALLKEQEVPTTREEALKRNLPDYYNPIAKTKFSTATGKPYGEVRALTPSKKFRYNPKEYIKSGLKGLWADIRAGVRLKAESSGVFTSEDRLGLVTQTKATLAALDKVATKEEQARGLVFGTASGTMFLPLNWKTKVSIVGSIPKMESLFMTDYETSKEEKRYKLKDYGLSLGISVATGFVFGAGAKFGGKYLGKKGMEYILKMGSSSVGKTFPSATALTSLGLIGAGKTAQTGTDIYFRTKFLGEGIDVLQLTKEKKYESAKMKVTELTGGLFGFYGGSYVGGKTFYSLYTKPSIKEGAGVKTRVPTVQAGLLTSGQKVVAQRTEELSIKSLFNTLTQRAMKPNPDLWEPSDIESPTAQKFFRINPKFKKNGNVLSLPSFIGGKKLLIYQNKAGRIFHKKISPTSKKEILSESYSFFRKSGAGRVKSSLLAIGELPLMKLVMTRETRGISVRNKELKQKIEFEKAIKGGLSKKTKQDYLDYISKRRSKTKSELELSDKALQRNIRKGAYEEEAVARKELVLVKYRINFMADKKGGLIPIKEYGKSKGRFNLNTIFSNLKENWNFKSNVRKLYSWEAQKQYKLFKKFGERYVDPYQHSYPHGARTAEFATLLTYLEGKGDKKQIERAYKVGLMHDIAKSQEASGIEGGWEHGFRAWEIGRKGKLPLKVERNWLEAIKVHDTLKQKQFKKASIEKKILKSSDVLQLGFEFKNGQIVPSRYYKGKLSTRKGERGLRLEEVPIKDALGKLKRFTEQEPEKAKMLGEVFRISPSINLRTRISLINKILYPNKKFYHGTSKESMYKEISKYKKQNIISPKASKDLSKQKRTTTKQKPLFYYSILDTSKNRMAPIVYTKDKYSYEYSKPKYYNKLYPYSKVNYYNNYKYKPTEYKYPYKFKQPEYNYPSYPYKPTAYLPPTYPPTKYPPYIKPPVKYPPQTPPPMLIKPKIKGKKFITKKKTKKRKAERYTPSLSATILGIRAKRKPFKALGGSYFAGFRPIISR